MSLPLQVLLIEDSEDDALLTIEALRRAGYAPAWEQVMTATAMRSALGAREWDLVLCDYAMPGFDAFAALEVLQATRPDVPLIIVSGTIGEELAVEAIKRGAADYLLKDRLGRLGPAISRARESARLRQEQEEAEAAVRTGAAFINDVLNSLTAEIAVLDETGVITAVNEAWRKSAHEGGGRDGIGENYLATCAAGVGRTEEAIRREARDGIRRVLAGAVAEYSLEYPCSSTTGQRWLLMRVSPLGGTRRGAVLVQDDISPRRRSEEKIREQLMELQRWQEVMLKREDRVQALKAEVNALLARQNESPRYGLPSAP